MIFCTPWLTPVAPPASHAVSPHNRPCPCSTPPPGDSPQPHGRCFASHNPPATGPQDRSQASGPARQTPCAAAAEVTHRRGSRVPPPAAFLLAPQRGRGPPASPVLAQPGRLAGSLRRLSPLRGPGGSRARSGPEQQPQAKSAAPGPAPLMAAPPLRFRPALPPHCASAAAIRFRSFRAGHAGHCSPRPQGEGGGAAPPCGGEESQRRLRMRGQRPLPAGARRPPCSPSAAGPASVRVYKLKLPSAAWLLQTTGVSHCLSKAWRHAIG